MGNVIQKGDAYYLKCKVTAGDTEITPDTCDAIRFGLDDTVITDAEYDADLERWLIPLTQRMTLGGGKALSLQAQIRVDGDIITTKVVSIPLRESILDDTWKDEE